MQRRQWVVTIIMVINLAVFLLWHTADAKGEQWMRDNFLVSWDSLQDGRYWTLITSVFSHQLAIHILLNMFVLNSFGRIIELTLGHMSFLRLYLIAGIVSSFSHSILSKYIMDDTSMAALGASGAISAIVVLFSFMYPKEKLLIFGIIPVPALVGALFFIGLDVWGLVAQAHGGGLPIGHGAHLGGAFTGIMYYLIRIQPQLKKKGAN